MRALFGGSRSGHLHVDLLSAFLDRQTTQDERIRVETHLQTCAECRAELESLRHTVVLLHALPRVAAPRAFTLSEAQVGVRHPVGVRRPGVSPAWYGGALRGLGAVAGLVLVAFLAVSLLQRPAWIPGQTVAFAPTAADTEPASTVAPPVTMKALTEPTQQPALTPEQPVQAVAPMATVEPVSSPAAQPSPATALAAAPPPATQEDTRGKVEATATEPALAVMAEKAAETPGESARAMGRGGAAAGVASDLPPEALTPEPIAPVVPWAELPPGVRMVYADLKALYAVDPALGVRQVLASDSISLPQLSPDQRWIVYRTFRDSLRLWVTPWEGGEPRLLLEDGNLSKEGLPQGYAERRFNDSRWVPGNGHLLAVMLSAVGGLQAPDLPVISELWHLDVETGEFKFVAALDRAYRPFYSPKGNQFVTLQYGTETDPQATVMVYKLNNKRQAEGRVALRFQASPAKPSFESQVSWNKDGQVLLAVPDADPQFQNPPVLNGMALYRIADAGEAQLIGSVDAFQVAWSPDGEQMMYSRYTSDTMENVELYLAAADGTDAQLYVTTRMGGFISWSPDGMHFLYNDYFQVYAGGPGQEPRRLTNAVSLWDPRWVSARQFVSLHDQGEAGWWWTLRSVDGAAASLTALPREGMIDVTVR